MRSRLSTLFPVLTVACLFLAACATAPDVTDRALKGSLAGRGGDASADSNTSDLISAVAQPGADAVVVVNQDEDSFSNPIGGVNQQLQLVADIAKAYEADPLVKRYEKLIDSAEAELANAVEDARSVDRADPELAALAEAADIRESAARSRLDRAYERFAARLEKVATEAAGRSVDLSQLKVLVYAPINVQSSGEDAAKLDADAITALAALADKLNAVAVKAVE